MKRTRLLLAFLIMVIFFQFVLSSCQYSCDTCRDRHTVVCADCNGKVGKRCGICGGDGRTTCYTCDGTGRKTCFRCHGLGGYMEYDFFSKMYVRKTCYNCVGGYQICPTTMTCRCEDGRIDCNTCIGEGRVACPDCSSDTGDPDETSSEEAFAPSGL